MNRKAKLGEILVKAGLIDEFQLRSALAEQSRWGGRLGVTLVKMRFLAEVDLVRTLSRIFGLPAAQISGKRILPEILELVEVEFAEKHGCIPLFKTREGGMDVLYLGMEDPRDLTAVDDLSFRLGLRVRPVLVGPIQLREAIAEYYRGARVDSEAHAIELTEVPVTAGDTEPVMEPLCGADDAVPLVDPAGIAPAAEPPAPPPPPPERAALFEMSRRADLGPDSGDSDQDVRESLDAASQDSGDGDTLSEIHLSRNQIAEAASEGDATDPNASSGGDGSKPHEVPTRTILQAVTRVLIDKGILTRAELLEAVKSTQERGE